MRKGFPPIVIKKMDSETYYGALSQADTGEYLPFLEFIAEQTHYALYIQQRGALGETIDDDDDFEKELFLLEKLQKGQDDFLELAFSMENAKDSFTHSILPVYTSISKKVESAGKLFIESVFGYYERVDEGGNWGKRHNYSFEKNTKINLDKDDLEHQLIVLTCFLNAYKNMENPFDIQISLLIKYEKLCFEIFYSFEIFGERSYFSELNSEGNKKLLLKQPYHKPLSNTEIKAATKIVSDAFLQKIKELSNT